MLSDHCMLKMSLCTTKLLKPGRGFWKLNTSTLNNKEFIVEMKKVICETGEKLHYLRDKNLLWEIIKLNIRNFPFALKKQKKKENIKKVLSLNYMLPDQNIENQEEYNDIKNELENFKKQIARGKILRSKIKWVAEGEKIPPTSSAWNIEITAIKWSPT